MEDIARLIGFKPYKELEAKDHDGIKEQLTKIEKTHGELPRGFSPTHYWWKLVDSEWVAMNVGPDLLGGGNDGTCQEVRI